MLICINPGRRHDGGTTFSAKRPVVNEKRMINDAEGGSMALETLPNRNVQRAPELVVRAALHRQRQRRSP
jgi:hypothetical protein